MDGLRGDHRSFGRLAALLLALADLAEQAGSRGFALRCLVLCLLRPAEAVTFAYVVQAAPSALLAAETLFRHRDHDEDEAVRLAWSFRLLAAVFRTLAHMARLAPRLSAGPALRQQAELLWTSPAATSDRSASRRSGFLDTS